MSRRGLFKIAWAALGACGLGSSHSAQAAPPEIKMPDGVTEQKFDFETKGIEGWTPAGGQWVVEDFAGAPVGKKALLQRATKNEFNVKRRRQAPGARSVALAPGRGRRRPHPGLARRRHAARSQRLALQVGSGRAVDKG